jgi:hypothetical protein
LGGRGRRISEFKASLVYKVSSRTARTIQRNPVSKETKKKKKKKKNPEVSDHCEVPCECWESKLSSLGEEPVLLTTGPCLSSPALTILYMGLVEGREDQKLTVAM